MAEAGATAGEPARDTAPSDSTLDAAADNALRKRLNGPIRVDKPVVLAEARAQGHGSWFGRWLGTSFGPGGLSADEFLYYGLYDTGLSPETLSRYAGKGLQQKLHRRCNDGTWFALAHNKLLLHHLLTGVGLVHPTLHGTRLRGGRMRSSEGDDGRPDAFERFLGRATYPLFAKPIEGMYSIGAMRLDGYRDGRLLRAGAEPVDLDRFVAYADAIDARGYLFQELLRAPTWWSERFGPGLPAVRVMVLLSPEGEPSVHKATAKLPDADQDADNFWREGNVLAPVDLGTGTLGQLTDGVGHERVRADVHPGTGATVAGTVLEGWDEALALVREAAVLLPGIRTQGWDVCLTDAGPVLLELNFGGDLNLHQLAHGEGMLTDEFCAHLRACGYKGKLPGAADA